MVHAKMQLHAYCAVASAFCSLGVLLSTSTKLDGWLGGFLYCPLDSIHDHCATTLAAKKRGETRAYTSCRTVTRRSALVCLVRGCRSPRKARTQKLAQLRRQLLRQCELVHPIFTSHTNKINTPPQPKIGSDLCISQSAREHGKTQ